MWTCPICNKVMEQGCICENCSFDESRNYEKYPTLSVIPDGIPSIAARKSGGSRKGVKFKAYTRNILKAEKAIRRKPETYIKPEQDNPEAPKSEPVETPGQDGLQGRKTDNSRQKTDHSPNQPDTSTGSRRHAGHGRKILFIAAVMLIALLSALTYHMVTNGRVLAQGTSGTGLRWTLKQNGVLTISGSGEMPDFETDSRVGWQDYRGQIQMVRLNGVDNIGAYAFENCTALSHVTLSGSVKQIETCAFLNCTSLDSLTIPANVEQIDALAFAGCAALDAVHVSADTQIDETAFPLQTTVIPDAVSQDTDITEKTSGGWNLEKLEPILNFLLSSDISTKGPGVLIIVLIILCVYDFVSGQGQGSGGNIFKPLINVIINSNFNNSQGNGQGNISQGNQGNISQGNGQADSSGKDSGNPESPGSSAPADSASSNEHRKQSGTVHHMRRNVIICLIAAIWFFAGIVAKADGNTPETPGIEYANNTEVTVYAGYIDGEPSETSATAYEFAFPVSVAAYNGITYVADNSYRGGELVELDHNVSTPLSLGYEYEVKTVHMRSNIVYVLAEKTLPDGNRCACILRLEESSYREIIDPIPLTERIPSSLPDSPPSVHQENVVTDFVLTDNGQILWLIQGELFEDESNFSAHAYTRVFDENRKEHYEPTGEDPIYFQYMVSEQNFPRVTADHADNLYVTLPEDNEICMKKHNNDSFEVFAGVEKNDVFNDRDKAAFHYPTSLAADSTYLYVFDSGLVRRIPLNKNGRVQTLAGKINAGNQRSYPSYYGERVPGENTVLTDNSNAAIAVLADNQVLLSDPFNALIYLIETG